MPIIPIQQSGISIDPGGADLNASNQGLPYSALAQAGSAVTDMSLHIGAQLRNEEAVQTVAKVKAEREFQSRTKINELKASSEDGYVWGEYDGNRYQTMNADGTPRTITQEYRDWANGQYEADQQRMPSRVAQDMYKREMLNTYTDNMARVQDEEFSKRHTALKKTAIESGDIRATELYTHPSSVEDVLQKDRDNMAQNASLVRVGGDAKTLADVGRLQEDQLVENWAEGHYRVANDALIRGGELPRQYVEDALDVISGNIKPGNQHVNYSRHDAASKTQAAVVAENKILRAKGLPENPMPIETKTIASMATDSTRDRMSEKFLSLLKTRSHRADVEFESEVTGLHSYGLSKNLNPVERKDFLGQIAVFESKTLQNITNGDVLPLKGVQGIAKVRTGEKLGSFLGSRNYWSLPEGQKLAVEKQGGNEAQKLGVALYDFMQSYPATANKFSREATIGIAKLEWEKGMHAESDRIKTELRSNSGKVAQEANPAYRVAAESIDPTKGLAQELSAKGSKLVKVWDLQEAQSKSATGVTSGRNNFRLDDPQLQSWAKAFDNPSLDAGTLADTFQAMGKLKGHAINVMDGMVQNGLPEQYRTGLLVAKDRILLEQVTQVLVAKGTTKAEDEFKKNYVNGEGNLKQMNDALREKFAPYLPELEKHEALRGRNTAVIIDTLLSAARINAIDAARRQTVFDADKAAASGVAATLNRIYTKSDDGGHPIVLPRKVIEHQQGVKGPEQLVVTQDEVTANKSSVFYSRMRKDPEILFQMHPNIIIPSGVNKDSFKILVRDSLETGSTKDGRGHTIRVQMSTKDSPVRPVDIFEKDDRGRAVPLVIKTQDVILAQDKYDQENPGWMKTFWNSITAPPKFPVQKREPKI